MKKILDKVMAYFGYYPAKKLYDFPVEKAIAKKRPTVKKATTRTVKKDK
jgi:hypothetical protein